MDVDPGSWEVTIDNLLAAIASSSLAVANFIRSVRSARADLVQVTRELSDLRLELELLRDEHNVPPQIQPRGLAVLESCGVVIRRVAGLFGDPSSPKANKPDPARLPRWSVKERFETSNLCNCLQTYREAMTLLADVAALRSSETGSPTTDIQSIEREDVEEKSQRILEAVSDLREAIPLAEPAIADTKQILELYLSDVANYTRAACKYLVNSDSSESPVSKSKPPDPSAPAEMEGIAPRSPTRSRWSPAQDIQETASASARPSHSSRNPSGPFEAAGPWFPSGDLTVPFYNNQEQLLQHRANSYHVPRSPARYVPFPRPPPQSSPPVPPSQLSPPLPPPTTALPMLPPSASRPKSKRQRAELAGADAAEVRHVAQHYNPYHQMTQYDHNPADGYRPRHRSTPVHQHAKSTHSVERTLNRVVSADQFPQPPSSADQWATSIYVPTTPPSGQSSQRTSFQPSSLDSAPSRDTYRSSVSTGPFSVVDSLSPNTSPRTQLEPTFEDIAPPRPPSPRPSTTHSSGPPSAKGSSFKDKIPGVFRSKRKSLQGSADLGQSAYRTSLSSGSSSTVEQPPAARNLLQSPLLGSANTLVQDQDVMARRAARQIEIMPAEGLSEGKGPGIHHIEISPSGAVIATQHANNTVKVWSVTTGAVEGLIKYSSKVTPGPRTRMYFLRPHAIMSEASTLAAVTTSFGNTIEIWNWAKKKKIQSIDHAARWASVPGDVFEANMRPLAVYRSESDRIDLYTATRDAKKPFVESRRINLKDAELPFVPKFPDLAYSSTGPLLVGAAGPRPGAPPEAQQTILLAWQIDEQQENPRPYRWVVPDHPELNGALPSYLATYGSVAVSIWFPANYKHIITVRGENKKVPVPMVARHVLVWDLATNRTRTFSIPNAVSCVSPDCRYLAYCSPEQNRFVVMDISSGAEVWSGPDELDVRQAGGSAAASQQLYGDLSKVTEFRFTDDSGLLYVADQEGGIGIYEVRQTGGNGRTGSVSTASGGVAGRYEFTDMKQTLSRTRLGDTRA